MNELELSVLNEIETRTLRKCEKIVAEGMAQFVGVGRALEQIRENKLWRGKYDSFKDYLDRRWSMSTAHATRLISGSEIATRVGNIPNECVAREVAKIPYTEQKTVVERAVEASKTRGVKLSAALIRDVAKEPTSTSARRELQTEQPWEAEGLEEGWSMAMDTLIDLKEICRKLSISQQGCWLKGQMDTVEARIKDLETIVRYARPYCPCPDCAGGIVAKCDTCKSRGWLPESKSSALKRKKIIDTTAYETTK
jgi:hypothetical protein